MLACLTFYAQMAARVMEETNPYISRHTCKQIEEEKSNMLYKAMITTQVVVLH